MSPFDYITLTQNTHDEPDDELQNDIAANPVVAPCSLLPLVGAPTVLTPNNPITAGFIRALSSCGKPFQETEDGWHEGALGWEFGGNDHTRDICFSASCENFAQVFGASGLPVDIAALALITGTAGYRSPEPTYLTERTIYDVLNFASFGEKRLKMHNHLHSTTDLLNSIQVSCSDLPSSNKRKPFAATDDFPLRLTPMPTASKSRYSTIWKVTLGKWAHAYLNPKRFYWTASLPTNVFTLGTRSEALRIAKTLVYQFLGFPGGTHHFTEGTTTRKIQTLLFAVGAFPKTNSMKEVKNWKHRVRKDMDRAFAILCEQGFMESVAYDPPPDNSRYWFDRWLRTNVVFVLKPQTAANPARILV